MKPSGADSQTIDFFLGMFCFVLLTALIYFDLFPYTIFTLLLKMISKAQKLNKVDYQFFSLIQYQNSTFLHRQDFPEEKEISFVFELCWIILHLFIEIGCNLILVTQPVNDSFC